MAGRVVFGEGERNLFGAIAANRELVGVGVPNPHSIELDIRCEAVLSFHFQAAVLERQEPFGKFLRLSAIQIFNGAINFKPFVLSGLVSVLSVEQFGLLGVEDFFSVGLLRRELGKFGSEVVDFGL